MSECMGCGEEDGVHQCADCNSFVCVDCYEMNCSICTESHGCACCVRGCSDCDVNVCGYCEYHCDIGGGHCDRVMCEDCVTTIGECLACSVKLQTPWCACGLCAPHIEVPEEAACGECHHWCHVPKPDPYKDMTLPEARDRVVLKACLETLRQIAEASKWTPGHAAYKRLREEVAERGAFARRSPRLAARE